MKNLHITCNNMEQRQNVFDVLESLGLRHYGNDGEYLQINAEINQAEPREYMTVTNDSVWPDSQILNYTQFMEQYAMQTLKNKITKATEHLNISQSKLSKRLNKSRNYLSEMVRNGCTTAKQKELIGMIDMVMCGEVFKSDGEIIAELTEKLSNAQDAVIFAEEELKIQCDQNIGISQANTELNQELNTMRKNAQEADIALKQAKDDLDCIKAENDQLREAVSNRDSFNQALNAENKKIHSEIAICKHNLSVSNEALNDTNSKIQKDRWIGLFMVIVIVILSFLLVRGV